MAQATQAERARRERWGFLSGSIMALGASLSFAAARAGVVGGLAVPDMIFARFLVAGAIMLPLLVRWGLPTLAGISLKRACLLTALGGAPFALLQTGVAAIRWQRVALACGAALPPGQALRFNLIASFFNQVLPSTIGGDAARIWLLARAGAGWMKARSYSWRASPARKSS